MKKALGFLRNWLRLTCAAVIWLHALFLINVPPLRVADWAQSLGMNVAEVTLLLLIGTLWIFSIYGYGRLWVDAAYIYFFPFVILYNIGRMLVSGVRFLVRSGSPESSKLAESIVVPKISISAAPQVSKPSGPGQHVSNSRRAMTAVTIPVRRFAPLWWLMIWLASKQILIWVASAAVLLHLFRAVLGVFRLSFISIRGLMEKLEDHLRTYTEGLITKLLGIDLEGKIEQEAKNVVSNLAGIRVAIGFVGKSRDLGLLIFCAGVCLFLVVHIYLAAFFTFSYLAISRLQSIPYTLFESAVTALFMPLTFGDLPHNSFMKVMGGLQSLLMFILGAGEVFAYFQRKVATLQMAAQEINERINREEIRNKLEQVQKRLKPEASSG